MTLCTNCGKDLSKFKSIYSVFGYLYCSRECYIEDLQDDDFAEEVNPVDIGLVVENENSSKEANV